MSLAVAVLLAGCGAGAVARKEVTTTADGSMSIPELVRRIALAAVQISTEDVTANQFGRAVPTGGRVAETELVGADGLTDLAVLKIDPDGLTIAPLGPSMELEVGETVVAMGHALDLPGGRRRRWGR